MEKSILDIMINRNEFPIIFIGSGIPRRYLVKYPGWEELLEEFWRSATRSQTVKSLRTSNGFPLFGELVV